MALSLLTVKTVLLFAVWLPIAAYIGFGLSNLGWVYVPASSLFVPVSLLFSPTSALYGQPLAGLLFIHRKSMGRETLRTLSWMTVAVICSALFSYWLWASLWLQPVSGGALRVAAALGPSNAFWLVLCLGAVASLRWHGRPLPDTLIKLVPPNLLIPFYIAVLVPAAYAGGFLIALAGTWTYWAEYWTWPVWPAGPEFTFYFLRAVWRAGSMVSDILVLSVLMAFLANWPGFVPQLRRVILGGLAGTIAAIALQAVLYGAVDFTFTRLQFSLAILDTSPQEFSTFMSFSISAAILGWLGLTLGVWAGIRWPERLLLPSVLSAGTQRVRLAKNLIAIAVYLVLAIVLYWIILFRVIEPTYGQPYPLPR